MLAGVMHLAASDLMRSCGTHPHASAHDEEAVRLASALAVYPYAVARLAFRILPCSHPAVLSRDDPSRDNFSAWPWRTRQRALGSHQLACLLLVLLLPLLLRLAEAVWLSGNMLLEADAVGDAAAGVAARDAARNGASSAPSEGDGEYDPWLITLVACASHLFGILGLLRWRGVGRVAVRDRMEAPPYAAASTAAADCSWNVVSEAHWNADLLRSPKEFAANLCLLYHVTLSPPVRAWPQMQVAAYSAARACTTAYETIVGDRTIGDSAVRASAVGASLVDAALAACYDWYDAACKWGRHQYAAGALPVPPLPPPAVCIVCASVAALYLIADAAAIEYANKLGARLAKDGSSPPSRGGRTAGRASKRPLARLSMSHSASFQRDVVIGMIGAMCLLPHALIPTPDESSFSSESLLSSLFGVVTLLSASCAVDSATHLSIDALGQHHSRRASDRYRWAAFCIVLGIGAVLRASSSFVPRWYGMVRRHEGFEQPANACHVLTARLPRANRMLATPKLAIPAASPFIAPPLPYAC